MNIQIEKGEPKPAQFNITVHDQGTSRDGDFQPNFSEAERFLSALDPDATSWTFQTFDDNYDRKDGCLARIYHGALEQHWGALCDLSDAGAGIFVTINETDGRGRGKDNITRVRAVFVDTDGADTTPILEAKPRVGVESSPNNFHYYWTVSDCPLDDFKPAQQHLAEVFGTDKAVNDLPRVLRLPGFVHQKVKAEKGLTGEKFMVRIVHQDDRPPEAWERRKAAIFAMGGGEPAQGQLPLSTRAMAAVRRRPTRTDDKKPSVAEVSELLSHIDPARLHYDEWLKVVMALHWCGEEFEDIAHEWSARDGKRYNPDDLDNKWRGFNEAKPGGVTVGTLAAMAKKGGANVSAIAKAHSTERPFEELVEAAKALTPETVQETEALIADMVGISSVKRDHLFRLIKDATGTPLGALRDQFSANRDAVPEPDHLDIANMTLEQIGRDNIICADAFVWRWQDRGVWAAQDDRAIKQSVQKRIAEEEDLDVMAPLVNAVADVLKTSIYRPNHQFNLGDPETVNCTNGELVLDDLVGWHLVPHCREHYRTTQIPVAYDPNADAPMFRAFLDQVFRDDDDREDKIKAVFELMGYSAMSHARHELFVMLIGPGANGKSVLLSVLEALLGPENVAGVQPASFDRSFQRAHLHQKLANIVTEIKQGEVIADAELKAITSGEPSTVEHKFKDPFVMRPFSTCWFGTNHMPHTRDFSEALFRRAVILQFNRTFSKDEQDPMLKTKLMAELPGILRLSLDAYERALTSGFTAPASSEAAKAEWRLEADQVAQFVEDKCRHKADARVPVSDVFEIYRRWAEDTGVSKTMSQRGLRERLTRLGFGAQKSGSVRYVTGMVLTTKTLAENLRNAGF